MGNNGIEAVANPVLRAFRTILVGGFYQSYLNENNKG